MPGVGVLNLPIFLHDSEEVADSISSSVAGGFAILSANHSLPP